MDARLRGHDGIGGGDDGIGGGDDISVTPALFPVTPEKAGVQVLGADVVLALWMPAFAGMTGGIEHDGEHNGVMVRLGIGPTGL